MSLCTTLGSILDFLSEIKLLHYRSLAKNSGELKSLPNLYLLSDPVKVLPTQNFGFMTSFARYTVY